MNELIPISALIGDRTYRIKIEPADEELIRKTLKAINEQIMDFKTRYAGKDMQDYIAMALIWYATEKNEHSVSGHEQDGMMEDLGKLDRMMDEMLAKNQESKSQ